MAGFSAPCSIQPGPIYMPVLRMLIVQMVGSVRSGHKEVRKAGRSPLKHRSSKSGVRAEALALLYRNNIIMLSM